MILCIENWSEIISSIITVIGVLFTVYVGFRQFKENKWCENVSKERTIWLKEFRQEVGKILKAYSFLKKEDELSDSNNNDEKLKEKCLNPILLDAEEARYVLITRINTNKVEGNEFNFEYKKMLKELEFDKNKIQNFNIDKFIELTNLILELEWKKIKMEANGEFE